MRASGDEKCAGGAPAHAHSTAPRVIARLRTRDVSRLERRRLGRRRLAAPAPRQRARDDRRARADAADADPLVRGQALAEDRHRRQERDHRNREHVERRGARGQEAQHRDPQQEARTPSRRRRRRQQQRRSVDAPLRRRQGEHERQQRQRQHADQHLPRDEVERVEAVRRAGNTWSRPCPPPSRSPTAPPTASARGRRASATARPPARARRARRRPRATGPRTRSCSTGHAISSVQNGIVNTSTDVRPAPPPASAIVVEPKLIVVWKKPVTTTAIHDSGSSGRRCQTSTANRTAIGEPCALRR